MKGRREMREGERERERDRGREREREAGESSYLLSVSIIILCTIRFTLL